MKKILAVLALILLFVLPLSAQIGADSAVAFQVAQIWLDKISNPTKEFVACANSHEEGENLNIDSIVKLVAVGPDSTICKGLGNTVLAFITETTPGAENAIFENYLLALPKRPDLKAVGTVHGVIPEVMPNGHRVYVPLIWVVWRSDAQKSDTLKKS